MKIFLDSSIIVEYLKGRQPDFLEQLLDTDHTLLINTTVISEVYFHFLGVQSQNSPLTVKRKERVPELLPSENLELLLDQFVRAPEHKIQHRQIALLMHSYNLLPSDAIILATCLSEQIPCIASFDADFTPPCQAENITLLHCDDDLRLL